MSFQHKFLVRRHHLIDELKPERRLDRTAINFNIIKRCRYFTGGFCSKSHCREILTINLWTAMLISIVTTLLF